MKLNILKALYFESNKLTRLATICGLSRPVWMIYQCTLTQPGSPFVSQRCVKTQYFPNINMPEITLNDETNALRFKIYAKI